MQDGLYLSTYLNPAGLAGLVSVPIRLNENFSLWEKSGTRITLVRHWELERISGMKEHCVAMLDVADAQRFINGLLRPLGVDLGDVREVWGTPGLSTVDEGWIPDEYPALPYHSVAHVYSSMLLDSAAFFDGTILGLGVDHAPDNVLERHPNPKKNRYSGAVVRHGDLDLFPVHSPGPLFNMCRRGFWEREGTLMALATATSAKGHADWQAMLDYDYMTDNVSRTARQAIDAIAEQVEAGYSTDPNFTDEENFASAVMKEVQALSIAIMEHNVEQILERYRLDPAETSLALSGGYALNCPTNSHLMKKYGFRRFMAPPVVSDTGQSIGMALATFHKRTGGRPFEFTFPGPYLGRDDPDLELALREHEEFIADVTELDLERAVADLDSGPIAWFNGNAEIGPRALGNRSLLGDPASYQVKTELNRLKRRQWWRPVAPVVLEEHLHDWFEDARPSPYMLETFTIRAHQRDRIPAVAHLDYSARIQSLSRSQNVPLHDLLGAFHAHSGIPMLCNTSLNDKGEPIVDTIAEAMNFCLRRGVRIGYFNGRRVAFRNHDAYAIDRPLPRQYQPFTPSPERIAEQHKLLNPYDLEHNCLCYHVHDPERTTAGHDPRTRDGARTIRKAAARAFETNPTWYARTGKAYFTPDGRPVDNREQAFIHWLHG